MRKDTFLTAFNKKIIFIIVKQAQDLHRTFLLEWIFMHDTLQSLLSFVVCNKKKTE